jgi:hypothetical protein
MNKILAMNIFQKSWNFFQKIVNKILKMDEQFLFPLMKIYQNPLLA